MSAVYLYTKFTSTIKGGSQDEAFWVQGVINLPSLSALSLFVGKNTEEGLPKVHGGFLLILPELCGHSYIARGDYLILLIPIKIG